MNLIKFRHILILDDAITSFIHHIFENSLVINRTNFNKSFIIINQNLHYIRNRKVMRLER